MRIIKTHLLILLLLSFTNVHSQWNGHWNMTSGFIGGAVITMSSYGNTIVAGTKYGGVFISTDEGENWSQTSLNTGFVLSICLNSSAICAGFWNQGAFYSTDKGLIWNQIFVNYHWNFVVSDSSNFFSISNSMIYKSSDGCQNWTNSIKDNLGGISCFKIINNIFYVGTWGNGIFSSPNGESGWNHTLNNRRTIRAITENKHTIIAGSDQNFIFRSTNMGTSWETYDFTKSAVLALTANDMNIFIGTDSGVYISTDNGLSWKQTSLKNKTVYSMLSCGSKVFCGTENDGIFLSTNNGKTWVCKTDKFNIKPIDFKIEQFAGSWTDFKAEPMVGYFATNRIDIEIKADSIFYRNIRGTDDWGGDSCRKDHGYEYAAGNYRISNDSIFFSGNWTDKTYKNILTYGCFNIGKFELTYKYTYYNNDILVLDLIDPPQLSPNSTGIKTKLYLYKK